MILPSKHLSQDRALLTVGANILRRISQPITISALWEELGQSDRNNIPTLRYDAFILALDLLFFVGVVEINDGLLVRIKP